MSNHKYYFESKEGKRVWQSKRKDAGLLPWVRLPNAEGKRRYSEQCREELKQFIFDGQKVYCNVTKVSSSGMSRTIHFYVIKGHDLMRITHLIAGAADYTLTDDGLRVSGCGIDMRFAVLDSVHVANNLDIRSI